MGQNSAYVLGGGLRTHSESNRQRRFSCAPCSRASGHAARWRALRPADGYRDVAKPRAVIVHLSSRRRRAHSMTDGHRITAHPKCSCHA